MIRVKTFEWWPSFLENVINSNGISAVKNVEVAVGNNCMKTCCYIQGSVAVIEMGVTVT